MKNLQKNLVKLSVLLILVALTGVSEMVAGSARKAPTLVCVHN